MNPRLMIPFLDGKGMPDAVPYEMPGPDNYIDVPNFEFEATLQFTEWQPTRASSQFNFVCLDGPIANQHVSMLVSKLADVVAKCAIDEGKVYGKWTFYKRGSTFTIGLAD
jgi:hypothetical protein